MNLKTNIKEIIKYLLLTTIKISLIFCILVIILYISLNWKHTLLTSYSPNHNYKIIIKYIEPFPFGVHETFIYYGKDSFFFFNKKVIKVTLNNKGMALNDSNYKINWISNSLVQIKLFADRSPTEQSYQINFKKEGFQLDNRYKIISSHLISVILKFLTTAYISILPFFIVIVT